MRLPTVLVSLGLFAALLLGCGGSGDSATDHLRTTDEMPKAPTPGSVAFVRSGWEATHDCKRPAGASRWACSVDPYRCQAVVTDRGWSVDCAKPGRSVAFTVRPGK